MSTRVTLEANFSVHHLAVLFKPRSISLFSTFFVFLTFVSVFFSSTGLRIRVNKRVEHEANLSVHHLAMFIKPRRWMVCVPFLVPCFVDPALRHFVPVLLLNFPQHWRTLCCDSIVFLSSV